VADASVPKQKSKYEVVKAWRETNREKKNEQDRRYRAKHPETNKKAKAKYREANLDEIRNRDREAQATRRKVNPEAQRERVRRWAARRDEKQELIAGRARPTVCDICGQPDRRILFDHCHASGRFRGWLCDRCNRTLGQVKDDTTLLRKMIDYLEQHNGKTHSQGKEGATEQ